jgi:hypothetical protein
MRIKVPQLGLAAYIRMKGADLVEVADRQFVFESDKSVSQWRTEYANSESMRHDSLVCELRQFLTTGKPPV